MPSQWTLECHPNPINKYVLMFGSFNKLMSVLWGLYELLFFCQFGVQKTSSWHFFREHTAFDLYKEVTESVGHNLWAAVIEIAWFRDGDVEVSSKDTASKQRWSQLNEKSLRQGDVHPTPLPVQGYLVQVTSLVACVMWTSWNSLWLLETKCVKTLPLSIHHLGVSYGV